MNGPASQYSPTAFPPPSRNRYQRVSINSSPLPAAIEYPELLPSSHHSHASGGRHACRHQRDRTPPLPDGGDAGEPGYLGFPSERFRSIDSAGGGKVSERDAGVYVERLRSRPGGF